MMRRKKSFVLGGLLFLAWLLPAEGAQRIDLEQAINYALTQNRGLAAARLDVQSVSYGIVDAEADFALSVRPIVSLSSDSDNNDVSVLGVTASKRFVTGTELSSRVASERFTGVDGSRERFSVSITQPLFRNAGRLVNEEPVVQARSSYSGARRRLEVARTDLIVQVVRTYESILRLQQQLEADQQSLARAESLYRLTSAKEAVGRTSRIDTLRVDLQRGQAGSRVEGDHERLASTQREFAELLGFEPGREFDLRPTKLLSVNVPEMKAGVSLALANRLEYAQVQQDLTDAQRGILIARKGLWPDVRLVGRYEHNSDAFTLADGTEFGRNVWFVGVDADTDFNRIRERNAVDRSVTGEAAARERMLQTELAIQRDVQQRILAYQRAHSELKILERNATHAEARLRLAQRLFEIGRGDNFSVTDAEESYIQAQIQLFAGRSSASVTGYELLQSLGTLTEFPHELKPYRL